MDSEGTQDESSSTAAAATGVVEVGDKPFQPREYDFPKRSLARKLSCIEHFRLNGSTSFDVPTKRAFCHTCVHASQSGLLTTRNSEPSFIKSGFQNWKEAMRVMSNHEVTSCHKEAVEKLITLPQTTHDVGELLHSQLTRDRTQSWENLLLILRVVKFLARQDLSLRGATKASGEVDGIFLQMLSLFGETNPGLLQWMERRRDKYTVLKSRTRS